MHNEAKFTVQYVGGETIVIEYAVKIKHREERWK